MFQFKSFGVEDTQGFARRLAEKVNPGTVVALFGGLGMGKTAFTHGFVKGRNIEAEVSSPTFAIVNEYAGNPSVYHFDMYRVEGWEDLYSTGFFDYIDMGGILVTEWSENIEAALPEDNIIRVTFERGEKDNERIITVTGVGEYENISC